MKGVGVEEGSPRRFTLCPFNNKNIGNTPKAHPQRVGKQPLDTQRTQQ